MRPDGHAHGTPPAESRVSLIAWNRTRSKGRASHPRRPRRRYPGCCGTRRRHRDHHARAWWRGEDVLFNPALPGAALGLRPGSLVIDMSSILPEQAQSHGPKLSAQGVATWMPQSQAVPWVRKAERAIMAGGKEADFERAAPCWRHSVAPCTWAPPAPVNDQARQPDDCRHHDRRGRRSPAAGAKGAPILPRSARPCGVASPKAGSSRSPRTTHGRRGTLPNRVLWPC